MSRLVLALASAFAFTACASDFKPLPAHLDPSNPEAPEAPPLVASTTLSPPEPANPPAHADHGAAPTVYTCPMHPEVRSDQPGRCPKCGMNLVPMKPSAADAGTAGDHQHHGGKP